MYLELEYDISDKCASVFDIYIRRTPYILFSYHCILARRTHKVLHVQTSMSFLKVADPLYLSGH